MQTIDKMQTFKQSNEMNIISEIEVDSEIRRIKGASTLKELHVKKTNVKNINVLESLQQLAQELDYLGISSLSEALETSNSGKNLVTNLIYATKDLIYIHKKVLSQNQDQCVEYVQLQKERQTLDKVIENQTSEIASNKKLLKNCQDKINKMDIEISQLQRDYEDLKQQNKLLRKQNASLECAHKNKMTKASFEIEQLRLKFKQNCTTYVSQDEIISNVLEDYKNREVVFKDMIKKLSENNEILLGEILNLKEDIVLLVHEREYRK